MEDLNQLQLTLENKKNFYSILTIDFRKLINNKRNFENLKFASITPDKISHIVDSEYFLHGLFAKCRNMQYLECLFKGNEFHCQLVRNAFLFQIEQGNKFQETLTKVTCDPRRFVLCIHTYPGWSGQGVQLLSMGIK